MSGYHVTGDFRPVSIWQNGAMIGGYTTITQPLPAVLTGTYNDRLSITAQGAVIADPTPSPTSPVEPVFATCRLSATSRDGDQCSHLTLPTLRAIPDGADGLSAWDELTHVGNGQYDLTRRVGVRTFDGTENIVWYDIGNTQYYSPYFAVECDAAFTSRTICLCNCLPGRERVSISIKDNNCVGVAGELVALNGKPGIMLRSEAFENKNIDAVRAFLQARAANGTPFTVWYQLAEEQVERVTLGTLEQQIQHRHDDAYGRYLEYEVYILGIL